MRLGYSYFKLLLYLKEWFKVGDYKLKTNTVGGIEAIHPFQDGYGRVGRVIIFEEITNSMNLSKKLYFFVTPPITFLRIFAKKR